MQLALVSYSDERGHETTQLAVVGENTVHLLDNRSVGMGVRQTPSGKAAGWLKDAVFKKIEEAASDTKGEEAVPPKKARKEKK